MKLNKKFSISILVLLLFLASSCSFTITDVEITKAEAEEIALEDAPDFKPNNSEFEIYQIDKIEKGWRVMISSLEPGYEGQGASPNIWYEISDTGEIIRRENMALGE